MNEYAQPMWYGFLTSSTVGDLEPHLKGLLDRHRRLLSDPGWLPSAIYIDNCCDWCVTPSLAIATAIALTLNRLLFNLTRLHPLSRRARLQALFPGVPILLDLYHWFERWDDCVAVKTGTVLSNMFCSHIRDAVLTPILEEYDNAKAALQRKNGKVPKHAEILRYCSRVVLPPAKLRESVDQCFAFWWSRELRLRMSRMQRHLLGGKPPLELSLPLTLTLTLTLTLALALTLQETLRQTPMCSSSRA